MILEALLEFGLLCVGGVSIFIAGLEAEKTPKLATALGFGGAAIMAGLFYWPVRPIDVVADPELLVELEIAKAEEVAAQMALTEAIERARVAAERADLRRAEVRRALSGPTPANDLANIDAQRDADRGTRRASGAAP